MEWTWGLTMLSIFGVVLNNHQDGAVFMLLGEERYEDQIICFSKGARVSFG